MAPSGPWLVAPENLWFPAVFKSSTLETLYRQINGLFFNEKHPDPF